MRPILPVQDTPREARAGVGRKIGLGCGGALAILFLMGSCVALLGADDEVEPVATTVTATVTATPAAVTHTIEAVETVTAEAATETVTQTLTAEAETETETVTETVVAQAQGIADLPAQPAQPAQPVQPTPASPAQPAAPPAPAGPVPPADGWPNCTAAWEAGAAPVYRGDPGYHSRLDRDNDGIGCERRP